MIVLFFILCLICFPKPAVAIERHIIIAKPFGPSTDLPDPAVGGNGWYTNEAGITETLFVLDDHMEPIPWLAQSYKNIDSLTWEIRLKQGILFHDDTPLSAEAVKASLERMTGKESPVFNKRLQALLDIQEITVKDERSLLFLTTHPNASFIYDLTSPDAGIVRLSPGNHKLYGTGPFYLKKVVPQEEMTVSRFDKYWGGKPALTGADFKIIKNPLTRMLAFESRQVDIAVNFPETDAERVTSEKGVGLHYQPTNRVCFFFVRVKDGPFSSPVVLKAVNYAIDREEIVNTVLSKIGGEVGASIFPPTLPWCNTTIKPWPYDPEKARELLTSAGAKDTDGDGILEIDGRPFIINAWTYEQRASLKPTLELIQQQIGKVGISMVIKVTQKGSPINEAMKKGRVELNLQMWNVAPNGDPDFFISNVFVKNSGSNFMGYVNPELDGLTKKGKTVFNREERKKIYDRIQSIVYEESPVIVLFYKNMVSAVHENVKNYKIHPAEKYIMTKDLYLDGS
ncbi:MAG: ABC transporter substrate-binding protein [Proteobacteria bacterium]|nr:ABC transporter substrate-binding protein [Pseudomonadota bacterium]